MIPARSAWRATAASAVRFSAALTSEGSTGSRSVVSVIASRIRSCSQARRQLRAARPRSADDLEVGEAGQDRLPTHRGVLEHDRDLLVAAGQLGGHDDPVAPAGVADAVAV